MFSKLYHQIEQKSIGNFNFFEKGFDTIPYSVLYEILNVTFVDCITGEIVTDVYPAIDDDYSKTIDLTDYAKKVDLDGYVTRTEWSDENTNTVKKFGEDTIGGTDAFRSLSSEILNQHIEALEYSILTDNQLELIRQGHFV